MSTTSMRVFFQDSSLAIREFRHSTASLWSGGTSGDDITLAGRRRAPLAAKEWTESGMRRMRVYTLDAQNNVREVCCDDEASWVDGHHGPAAAPFSDIATTVYDASQRRIRVYYQLPDRQIQELCNDVEWVSGATMRTLPAGTPSLQPIEGTAIASVGWGDTASDIRNYVQDDNGHICEYSTGSGWGAIRLGVRAKLHSPLAAVTWVDSEGRQIRIYYLDDENIIREYFFTTTKGWYDNPLIGSISTRPVKAAPYSRLSSTASKYWIRVYYQPSGLDAIEELCCDFGDSRGWYNGARLSVTPPSSKPIDVDVNTYTLGWLPYLIDDPLAIDGAGILIGFEDGHLISEDLKHKQAMYLAANTKGNSYTYVYTPNGSIVYRLWKHDHRDDYVRHSQVERSKDAICAGEFRVSQAGHIESVVLMKNDSGEYDKPTGGKCLARISEKLESMGITTNDIDWYWK
ncbi:hypothetical protein PLEOSDRAFT_153813 [Pleurotus ostreatus PC15]|uniref:Uncharacterized protein n=1 Tax=Pleurotus ostreatus (strain PC15) TaxID=1137138 RepID=A0A067P7U0_PLEO1|nr:hypothetical protein PLEOSDRAFT_153813 [Pleurotus ostreatus PC15]